MDRQWEHESGDEDNIEELVVGGATTQNMAAQQN
jgi:hypothetical protein